MHQYVSSSQLIVSTEDSEENNEDNYCVDYPSLEQAYKMMGQDKFSSDVGFMFAPKLSGTYAQ